MSDHIATTHFSIEDKGEFRRFLKGDEVPGTIVKSHDLATKGLVGKPDKPDKPDKQDKDADEAS